MVKWDYPTISVYDYGTDSSREEVQSWDRILPHHHLRYKRMRNAKCNQIRDMPSIGIIICDKSTGLWSGETTKNKAHNGILQKMVVRISKYEIGAKRKQSVCHELGHALGIQRHAENGQEADTSCVHLRSKLTKPGSWDKKKLREIYGRK